MPARRAGGDADTGRADTCCATLDASGLQRETACIMHVLSLCSLSSLHDCTCTDHDIGAVSFVSATHGNLGNCTCTYMNTEYASALHLAITLENHFSIT